MYIAASIAVSICTALQWNGKAREMDTVVDIIIIHIVGLL